jgi:hypothetical protein
VLNWRSTLAVSVLLLSWLLVSPSTLGDEIKGTGSEVVSPAADKSPAAPKTCTPRAQCCKVCSKGQACGNSCISASYTCHKGRGCSCNASEICQ